MGCRTKRKSYKCVKNILNIFSIFNNQENTIKNYLGISAYISQSAKINLITIRSNDGEDVGKEDHSSISDGNKILYSSIS